MRHKSSANSVRDGPASYSLLVAGKPSRTPTRPRQGAHLLALRQAAGISQIQLADFLGVGQGTIAFWERSEKPPRGEVLPKMAKALGVSVDELLVETASGRLARRAGPVGDVQRVFEAVRKLPRKQQRKVIEMVDALVDRYSRRAS